MDPQSTLGSSNDTLEVLSQDDCVIHTEQIIIISRTGEQKFNPDEYGNITLNTASFRIQLNLPLPEFEQVKMPSFHRFYRADQNQTQFQSNPLHQDPHSIDLNMSTSTQHRETHPNQVRLFPTPHPPLSVAGVTSLHPSFLRPGHITSPRYFTPVRKTASFIPRQPRKNPDSARIIQTTPRAKTTSTISNTVP